MLSIRATGLMAWCTQCNQWNADTFLPCARCGTVHLVHPERLEKRDHDDFGYVIGAAFGVITGGLIGAMVHKATPQDMFMGAFIGLLPGLGLGMLLKTLSRAFQTVAF